MFNFALITASNGFKMNIRFDKFIFEDVGICLDDWRIITWNNIKDYFIIKDGAIYWGYREVNK